MKIEGTQKVEIEISEEMRKHIALEYLYEVLKWKSDYFIDENKVAELVTYTTSHTWTQTNTVREASALDKAVYAVVKELKNK